MVKLDFWSDGVFLGHRSAGGQIVFGMVDGMLKTRTVQREAYEYRWNKEDEEMAMMPTIDAVLDTPEVETSGVPTEDRPPVPRRLYIRVKDIEGHGAT